MDGIMQFHAGKNFIEYGAYEGWASNYWPPLYGILLNFGDDPFLTGKIISLLAAIITLFSIYLVANFFLNNKQDSLIVLTLVSSSYLFYETFKAVENHALEISFFFLSYYFFLTANKSKNLTLFLIAGALIGFASLSRYTAYSFVISYIIFLFFQNQRDKYISSSYFLVGFILICLPWWVLNTYQNGSPLHTWQFLNVAIGIWGIGFTESIPKFNSLIDIISNYPLEFIINFFENILYGLKIIVSSLFSYSQTGVSRMYAYLSIAFLIFFLVLMIYKKKLKNFIKYISLPTIIVIIFLLVTSLAFNFRHALAPAAFLFSTAIFIFYIKWFEKYKFVLLLILAFNTSVNYSNSIEFSNNFARDEGGQLSDLDEIMKIIDIKKGTNMVVGSWNPAPAFYTNLSWVTNPFIPDGDFCKLIDTNLKSEILAFMPYFPLYIDSYKKDFLYLTRHDYFVNQDLIKENLLLKSTECKNYEIILLFQSNQSSLYQIIRP
ncbi:glycosyltransferase family 39 protein [Gammaproteobacteria bacterium]|nr:glycosyltransferase family 39 protein [Gammaproteobacteria bacterium]